MKLAKDPASYVQMRKFGGALVGTLLLGALSCGRVHGDGPEIAAIGGSSSSANAGTSGSALGGSAGLSASAGALSTAAGSSAGGSGGAAPLGGATNGGNSGELAGAAGAAGDSSEPVEDPNTDHTWARWPMPNTVLSGLPNPASYAVTTDVVVDQVTGLIWQRGASAAVAWETAGKYCEDLTLAGSSAWRLPSRIELISLMAAGRNGTGELSPFPAEPYSLWSASHYGTSNAGDAFSVIPLSPAIHGDTWAALQSARCVRTGASPKSKDPTHVVMTDVVIDSATGLTWQRHMVFGWEGFHDAAKYCADLSLANHADWRVPSLQELSTLVDERHIQPALNTVEFPDDEAHVNAWTWSSTTYVTPSSNTYGPGLRFLDGTTLSQPEDFTLSARCVR